MTSLKYLHFHTQEKAAPMGDLALKVENISKAFGRGRGKIQALDQVSLEVKKGELFGIIGPDGAGKTTLFRIMTSLMIPDNGLSLVEGYDSVRQYRKVRELVGYMPGRFSLYQDLSVEENLKFFATLFGTDFRTNYGSIRTIYQFLEPFKDRMAGKLSGGMKQKLALCCALIHDPKVLFLDEPTTGVDPVSRKEFWEMLDLLRKKGITVIASTPYMNEARRCDRIAIMQDGKIRECNPPDTIRAEFPFQVISVKSNDMFRLLQDLREYPYCKACHAFGSYQHLYIEKGLDYEEGLCRFLQERSHEDIKVKESEVALEDCFMYLMGKQKGGDHEA